MTLIRQYLFWAFVYAWLVSFLCETFCAKINFIANFHNINKNFVVKSVTYFDFVIITRNIIKICFYLQRKRKNRVLYRWYFFNCEDVFFARNGVTIGTQQVSCMRAESLDLTPGDHQHLTGGKHLVPSAWRTPHPQQGWSDCLSCGTRQKTAPTSEPRCSCAVRRLTTTTPSFHGMIFTRPRQQPPPIARARLAGTTLGRSSPSTCGPHPELDRRWHQPAWVASEWSGDTVVTTLGQYRFRPSFRPNWPINRFAIFLGQNHFRPGWPKQVRPVQTCLLTSVEARPVFVCCCCVVLCCLVLCEVCCVRCGGVSVGCSRFSWVRPKFGRTPLSRTSPQPDRPSARPPLSPTAPPPDLRSFFLSPAGNFILSSLSGGSSRCILVVFLKAGALKCAHFRGKALQTPPKFHERTPKREKKEKQIVTGERKKSAKFWPPTLRGPTPSRFHPSGLHRSGLHSGPHTLRGLHPSGPHSSGPHPSGLHPSGPHFF